MKRNCNLELQLFTPPAVSHSTDYNNERYNSMLDMEGRSPNEKQLTIFYNGRIAVCDVTELHARAIILLASRQTEDKSTSTSGSNPPSPSPSQSPSPFLSHNSPFYSPAAGLSMKRSLQRFLQKRKTRVQSTSPYHIPRNHH